VSERTFGKELMGGSCWQADVIDETLAERDQRIAALEQERHECLREKVEEVVLARRGRDVMRVRAAALEQENARLRAALEAVEWANVKADAVYHDCLWCHRHKSEGHAPDCQRQQALMKEADRGPVRVVDDADIRALLFDMSEEADRG
jgi:hypothetical protein